MTRTAAQENLDRQLTAARAAQNVRAVNDNVKTAAQSLPKSPAIPSRHAAAMRTEMKQRMQQINENRAKAVSAQVTTVARQMTQPKLPSR